LSSNYSSKDSGENDSISFNLKDKDSVIYQKRLCVYMPIKIINADAI